MLKSVVASAVAFSSLADDKSILSATYGLAGCVGIDTANAHELESHNCTIVDGKTNAIPRAAIAAFRLNGACAGDVRNGDAMPITFSAPVQAKSVDADDFKVTLNTGDVVTPICVFPQPANEENEMQTFPIIGYFGDGFADTKYAARVDIVGDIMFNDGGNAKGLFFEIAKEQRFTKDSPFLVQADLLTFSSDGESTGILPRGAYPNHCQHLYGGNVTHRARLVANGGVFLDGINSMLPNQTDLFQLLDAAGNVIVDAVVGLADLGNQAKGSFGSYKSDGDNFFDICLDSSRGPIDKITRVRMPCGDTKLYLPSGRTPCTDHSISVRNSVIELATVQV